MSVAPHTSIPSTTLQIGDRTLVVEATPLARSPQTRLGTVVSQSRPNALQLEQPISPLWRALVTLVLLLVALPAGLILVMGLLVVGHNGYFNSSERDALGLVAMCVCFCFFTVVFAALFGRRPQVRFTREQQLRISRICIPPGPSVTGRIVGVQLLFGRADEDLKADRPSFQINLILDNPQRPRVGFITYRDAEWTRAAGRKLADHLGVPLVDQLR